MPKFNSGVETGRDDFFIDYTEHELRDKLKYLFDNLNDETILKKYSIKDSSSFRFKKNLSKSKYDERHIKKLVYRPFDYRYNYYDHHLQRRPSFETLHHLLKENIVCNKNYSLNTVRQSLSENSLYAVITDKMICRDSITSKSYSFPLYLYPETNNQQSIGEEAHRKPNLNPEMVSQIAKGLGLEFVPDHEQLERPVHDKYFNPLDLLDYIYAVLHSPSYREKYKEFLKIDFPQVPYPKDADKFWKLVELGGEIRGLHLLESDKVEDYITSYPHNGDNQITTKIGKKDWELFDEAIGLGRIWINEEQCFDNIPIVAWEFYIGGYQPAQKWLKDRKGRTLEFDDILHYQKIIVALSETDRIMKVIDILGVE